RAREWPSSEISEALQISRAHPVRRLFSGRHVSDAGRCVGMDMGPVDRDHRFRRASVVAGACGADAGEEVNSKIQIPNKFQSRERNSERCDHGWEQRAAKILQELLRLLKFCEPELTIEFVAAGIHPQLRRLRRGIG
ncbi:MAG TPA: hypothetical protein VGF13_17410, partial [Verrucomicrobiae bacterium]